MLPLISSSALFIVYVADQEESTVFYSQVLGTKPALHVPGMTEFHLNEGCRLGLMPEKGIKKLLGDAIPDPHQASGIPRSELYLLVDDPEGCHQRALANGARELSPMQNS